MHEALPSGWLGAGSYGSCAVIRCDCLVRGRKMWRNPKAEFVQSLTGQLVESGTMLLDLLSHSRAIKWVFMSGIDGRLVQPVPDMAQRDTQTFLAAAKCRNGQSGNR